jgi:hypothetical protein
MDTRIARTWELKFLEIRSCQNPSHSFSGLFLLSLKGDGDKSVKWIHVDSVNFWSKTNRLSLTVNLEPDRTPLFPKLGKTPC